MKMKHEGFTHRVTWWDHTTNSDDVQKDIYVTSNDLENSFKLIEEHGIRKIVKALKGKPYSIEYYKTLQKIRRESLGKDYQIINLLVVEEV